MHLVIFHLIRKRRNVISGIGVGPVRAFLAIRMGLIHASFVRVVQFHVR